MGHHFFWYSNRPTHFVKSYASSLDTSQIQRSRTRFQSRLWTLPILLSTDMDSQSHLTLKMLRLYFLFHQICNFSRWDCFPTRQMSHYTRCRVWRVDGASTPLSHLRVTAKSDIFKVTTFWSSLIQTLPRSSRDTVICRVSCNGALLPQGRIHGMTDCAVCL